jgi:hypothetical protein
MTMDAQEVAEVKNALAWAYQRCAMRRFEGGEWAKLGEAGVRALRPWCAAFEDADDEGTTCIAVKASCADAIDALRTAGWRDAPDRERAGLDRTMQTLVLGAAADAGESTDESRRDVAANEEVTALVRRAGL